MAERSASELFDEFVTVIDKASSAKRIYDVPEAAEKLGMSGGNCTAVWDSAGNIASLMLVVKLWS